MTEASQTSATFNVSLSAYQLWQKCEQRYFYSYVRKIKPKETHPAPTLGRILHTYLEHYYKSLRQGNSADDSHIRSQLLTSGEFLPEIKSLTNTYLSLGYEDVAKEVADLPRLAGDLTTRYYVARGKSDAERYTITLVEEWVNLTIYNGIRSNGVIDLVTQDKETGRVNLWEHKSTKNIPPDSIRLRDFQTMLYAIKAKHQFNIIVDSIIWNYIRTTPPVTPEMLKSGGFTKRKNIDTTWEVYAETLAAAGDDPMSAEYDDIHERLKDRELTVFFPRYEQVIVVSESLLMNDYITESLRMRRSRADWLKGAKPIRTISRDCDYCEFRKICQAALTGGDEEDVIRMNFIEG